MSYWMNEGSKEFSFVGAKQDLLFEIVSLTRKKIRLKPKNNSYKYELVLIPFPEY